VNNVGVISIIDATIFQYHINTETVKRSWIKRNITTGIDLDIVHTLRDHVYYVCIYLLIMHISTTYQ